MGDMGDFWRDVKPAMNDESQQRRASNRENGAELLRAAGVAFESKNDGAHLIVRDGAARVFDFWPGTGLWQMRGTTKRQRGVRSLLSKIGKTRAEQHSASTAIRADRNDNQGKPIA